MRHIGVRKGSWPWFPLWLVIWTTGAEAQQAQLVWERDPGAERCPAADEIARAVNARLGYIWLTPELEQGERAFGRVSKVGGGYELLLTLRDAERRLLGTRRLQDASGDCATLAAASVLALTLMADAAPARQPGPAAAPRRVALGVEAGAAGSLGLLASPRVHAFVRLELHLTQRFLLEALVIGLGTARTTLDDAEAQARTTPALALVDACRVLLRRGRLRWDGCAGVLSGAIHVNGEHFSARNLGAWSAFVAAAARSPFRIRIHGPLQAGLALNLGVPLLNADYHYVDGAGMQRRVRVNDPLFAWIELGLGATF